MTAWLIRLIILAMIGLTVLVPLGILDLDHWKICEIVLCVLVFGASRIIKETEK